MELYLYLTILRRRWWLVLAAPLLVGAISLALALGQPPSYSTSARFLATRSSAVPVDGDDTVAYDLPAIVGAKPFAQDVVAELARRGQPLDAALVEQALHAENQQHVVTLSATAARPEDAVAIAQAAVDLIQMNGRRYWGDASAGPGKPGIDVAVLNPPAEATQVNGMRTVALRIGMRALAGLAAGVGMAFLLHYLEHGRRSAETTPGAGAQRQA